MTHEREALQELIGTEGWNWLVGKIRREFEGRGFQIRIGSALKADDPTAPKVVYNTSLEMLRVIQWPYERLEELKGVTE